MKYARKQVTDHGHATLEGVRGIRTDVPIRSSVRSPFPPFRIKSKQKVLRLNADMLDGVHLAQILAQAAGLGKPVDLTGLADGYILYYDEGSDTWKVEEVPGGSVAWGDVSGKPLTFPPEGHHESHEHEGDDEVTIDYADLDGVPSTFTPAAHQLDGAAHTVSGLTAGHFLKALTTTTFGFADPAHNILSATHGDALADSLIAGDILIANATPKLSRLAKGADGYVLTIDSSTHLPVWKAPAVIYAAVIESAEVQNSSADLTETISDSVVVTQTDS